MPVLVPERPAPTIIEPIAPSQPQRLPAPTEPLKEPRIPMPGRDPDLNPAAVPHPNPNIRPYDEKK